MSIIIAHKLLVAIFQNNWHTTLTKTATNSAENISVESESYTSLNQTYLQQTGSPEQIQGKQDTQIPGMQININTIQTPTNIPECKTMHELQQAMSQDDTFSVSRVYHTGLAREQRSNNVGHENIVDISR